MNSAIKIKTFINDIKNWQKFISSWLISQAVSIFASELLVMGFFVLMNIYVFGHKSAFHKKWEPYYKARNKGLPVSLTSVAAIARAEYIQEHSIIEFYTKYRHYDDWFYLDRVQGAPDESELPSGTPPDQSAGTSNSEPGEMVIGSSNTACAVDVNASARADSDKSRH